MVHDIQEPLRGWSRLSTGVVHRGSHLALHHDHVLQPDGTEGTYDRLTIADGARTVAVDARRRVALVEDAFYPPGRRLLHVPGGAIAEGECPREAARRECEEETGHRPATLSPLAVYHPLPSRTSAVTHLYLGTDLHPSADHHRDPTEAAMTVRWIPLDDAVAAVRAGEITEAGSVIGLLMAAREVTGVQKRLRRRPDALRGRWPWR